MYTKDDVARLVSELGEQKLDPALEVGEPTHFGLALDVFDPVSHEIITLARPHRRDTGQSEILLSAKQAVQAVLSARAHRLQSARNAGHHSIEAANEAAKRDADAKALASKQETERDALTEKQSEDAAKLAAESAPKPQGEPADDVAGRGPVSMRRYGDPSAPLRPSR
jgi:hypothetical protein